MAIASDKKSVPDNLVKDVDWRFGVQICSSDGQRVNSESRTYLQLKLTLQSGEVINCEMTLRQFNDLLQELERAKVEMQRIATT